MQENSHLRLLRIFLYAALGAAALFLAVRIILPCLFPFIPALLTAWMAEPAVRHLNTKLKFKRGFASVICIFALLMSLIGVLALVTVKLAVQAEEFIDELPSLLIRLTSSLDRIRSRAELWIDSSPVQAKEHIRNMMRSFSASLSDIPAKLSGYAPKILARIADTAPKAVLFAAAYTVGSFFISRSFPEIKRFLVRQIPPKFRGYAVRLKADIADGIIKWLRAQLLIMCITFAELAAAFLLLRFRFAILTALLTAVIDALPVFGTGVVLIPWAAALFLGGSGTKGAALLAVYAVVTAVRSFLEPKLVSRHFGVDPAAALLAMYSGFRLIGVWGMILAPLVLLLAAQLNDKGYIKLWK